MDGYYGICTFPDTVNSLKQSLNRNLPKNRSCRIIIIPASQLSSEQRRPQELTGSDIITDKGLRQQLIPVPAKQVLTFRLCFDECIPQ